MVILKKDGFWFVGSRKNSEREWEEYSEKIDSTSPGNSFDFLRYWEKEMTIEEGVTCNDFFMILADMDEALVTMIEILTDSNIKPHLRKAFNPPKKQPEEDESKLTAVEIYKILEISNWGSDQVEEPYLGDDYVCAHGIGKAWDQGFEREPMTDEEKIEKGCNVYAIEFTPWNELAHLPIKFRTKVHFGEVVWEKTGKKRKLISNGGDEDWNHSDMELLRDAGFQREVGWSPRVRDLFCGFTGELCFFGSPDDQEAQSAVLQGRMDDVEEMLKEEKEDKN